MPHGTELRRPAICAAWAIAACLWLVSPAFAQTFLDLTGRVVDTAEMLAPYDEAELDRALAAHEEKTANRVVLVTVPDLGEYGIDEYGAELGRRWGIGPTGTDNGVLLIVAGDGRNIRILTGPGLKAALTDERAEAIIEGAIAPAFKALDFRRGLKRGVDAILTVLESDALPTWIAPTPQTVVERNWMVFVAAAVVLVPLALVVRVRGSMPWFQWPTDILTSLLAMSFLVRNVTIKESRSGDGKSSARRAGAGVVQPTRRPRRNGPVSR